MAWKPEPLTSFHFLVQFVVEKIELHIDISWTRQQRGVQGVALRPDASRIRNVISSRAHQELELLIQLLSHFERRRLCGNADHLTRPDRSDSDV
jgi:hypothetical protein